MHYKSLRIFIALFMSLFMAGTSINPLVYAETIDETVPENTNEEGSTAVITGFETESFEMTVEVNSEDTLSLPEKVTAVLNDENKADLSVEWTPAFEGEFTTESEKDFTYTGTVDLAGYTLSEGLEANVTYVVHVAAPETTQPEGQEDINNNEDQEDTNNEDNNTNNSMLLLGKKNSGFVPLNDSQHTHGEQAFQPITPEDNMPSSSGYYYLTADKTVTTNWLITSNITLCLNGHKLIYAPEKGVNHAISVSDGATFTLEDESGNNGSIELDTSSSERIRCIYISYGTFDMEGGTIRNFHVLGNGGAVYVDGSGNFVMNNGTITGNRTSTGGQGGAIFFNGKSCSINGGFITGNSAGTYGGGIFAHSHSINVKGDVNITDNISLSRNTKDNVYLSNGPKIIVGEGGLSDTSKIGVTNSSDSQSYIAKAGIFTDGFSTGNAETIFSSDNSLFSVKRDGTEAALVGNTYNITIDTSEHGTVECDKDKDNNKAPEGATVTLTVKPNADYSLNSLTVVKTGTTETIALSKKSNNQYSFVMPNNHVTVNAVFSESVAAVTFNGVTTNYATFSEVKALLSAARNNDRYTVKLLNNVSFDSESIATVDVKCHVTLDLNGKTISRQSEDMSALFDVNYLGDFQIVDNSADHSGAITGNSSNPIISVNDSGTSYGGSLDLVSGTIENTSTGCGIKAGFHSIVKVEGGRIKTTALPVLTRDNTSSIILSGGYYSADIQNLSPYVVKDHSIQTKPAVVPADWIYEDCEYRITETSQPTHYHGEHSYTKCDSLPDSDGYHYLDKDIVLSSTWSPVQGSETHLCLNGHKITANFDGPAIEVRAGSRLFIEDCNWEEGMITHAPEKTGSGVLNHGTFYLTGGKIVGNTTNNSNRAAGVHNDLQSYFYMSAGEISNNHSSLCYGGGVGNYESSTFTITGGKIIDNSAPNGGGVYVYRDANMNIYGTVYIEGNLKTNSETENNVYLSLDKKISITSSLDSNSRIGITTPAEPSTDNPVVFTKDLKNRGSYRAFFSDNENYETDENEDYEAILKKPLKQYSIDIYQPLDHGTVTSSQSRANAGETIYLDDDPDEGYLLNHLIVKDSNNVTIYEYNLSPIPPLVMSFVMPKSAVTVYASFIRMYGSIGNVSITPENCADIKGDGITGEVSYNPETKELIFSNATITCGEDTGFVGITMEDSVNITGKVTIGGNCYLGIMSSGIVTVDGKDTDINISSNYSGIYAESVSINDGRVSIDVKNTRQFCRVLAQTF